ncbi:MAG: GNAT family N-acetyltransferase [Halanaerobiales bacterium]
MSLYIKRPTLDDEKEFIDMMSDWEQSKERIVPGIIKNYLPDYKAFLGLLDNCHNGIGLNKTQVPSTLYIFKEENNKILGAISIRHYLTEELKKYGGHIGYGIRPSERNKGYATIMLKLALEKAKELNIGKVMIHCDDDNLASSKIIIKNGGQIEFNGYYKKLNRKIRRYSILIV